VLSNRYYEVAPHVTLTGHHEWVIALIYSQPLWDGLNDEEKELIEEATITARDYSYELTQEKHEEFLEIAEENGVIFHELEDEEEIREIAEEVQEEYASENPLIEKFIEEANQLKNE